jgi:hypothetical protein
VVALFADIVFFVVAVALGGVEGDGGGAAGALVALVVIGNGRDGFGQGSCHASSPYFTKGEREARRRVPDAARQDDGSLLLLVFCVKGRDGMNVPLTPDV